jgi:hypothetical protein
MKKAHPSILIVLLTANSKVSILHLSKQFSEIGGYMVSDLLSRKQLHELQAASRSDRSGCLR